MIDSEVTDEIARQQDESQSLDEESVEENSGRVQPDYAEDKVVELPPILAIAAVNEIRISLERLLPTPLYTFLRDDWRSREETDLTMIMLRLYMLRTVVGETEVVLQSLLPFLESSRLSQTRVKIPLSGYQILRLQHQLDQQQFELMMRDRLASQWAFLAVVDGLY